MVRLYEAKVIKGLAFFAWSKLIGTLDMKKRGFRGCNTQGFDAVDFTRVVMEIA